VSDKELQEIKELYPIDTRIKLLKDMDDERLKAGATGRVTHVDDIGTIHMDWDCGSSLGLIVGKDEFEIEKIKVILVEVGEDPKVIEIVNSLEAKQEKVGGNIEVVPTFFSNEESYDFVMNEEWRIFNFTFNRYIWDKQDKIGGTFMVIKADEQTGEFIDMSVEETEFLINQIKEKCPPYPTEKQLYNEEIEQEEIGK